MKDLIIFDFDGTLGFLNVDWDKIDREVKALFRSNNIKTVSDIGYLRWIFASLDGLDPVKREIIETKVGEIIDKEEEEGARTGRIMDHCLELLKILHERYDLAISSNNGIKGIELGLKTMGIPSNYFKLIMSRNNAKLKPSTDPISKILKTIGTPKNVYVVGDLATDIIAAKEAQKLFKQTKITSIAIKASAESEGIEKENPDYIIYKFKELEKILIK